MAKKFACGGLMPGCDFVAEGETEEEVLTKVAQHAKSAHGIEKITDDLLTKVKLAIKSD